MQDLLPPKYRKYGYLIYALIGVAIGSIQQGFSAAEILHPVWLDVVFSVYIYVGTAFGLVAAGNTVTSQDNFSKQISAAG